MKTAGIIGGLGPETTAEFYLQTIFTAFKKNKKTRPPILMWSIPLEYQIEEDLLTKAEGEERYLPYLIDAAKRLESGRADFIVIPCNSVHIFIDQIRKSVNIPVLSIVEETSYFLKEKGIKKIGLLATLSTIEKKLYQKPLENAGIEINLPNDKDQDEVGKLIQNLVLNRNDEEDEKRLLSIISNFENKVDDVVLACTDLQLLKPEHNHIKLHDSMEILMESTVKIIQED
jgi:aspartate racemase